MKNPFLNLLTAAFLFFLAVNFSGCAAIKKKFTPKKKQTTKDVFFSVRKYDIKPSIGLYRKHYSYWLNWQRKLSAELGENFKSDKKSIDQAISNLLDMSLLLTDAEAAKLKPHIDKLRKLERVIAKRNITSTNKVRMRRLIEAGERAIIREFSPDKMKKHIREEFALQAKYPAVTEEDGL